MKIYDYSIHVCDSSSAEMADSRVLLRRSCQPLDVLPALVKNRSILKVTVESLQKMLDCYKCPLRKTSSKSAKIRELLKLPCVQNNTSLEERNVIDRLLTEMDAKRNSKKSKNNAAEGDADEDADEATTMILNVLKRIACHF